jgi:hypothetical protein
VRDTFMYGPKQALESIGTQSAAYAGGRQDGKQAEQAGAIGWRLALLGLLLPLAVAATAQTALRWNPRRQ